MATTLVIKGANFSTNKLATVSFDLVPCTALSLNENTLSFNTLGSTSTLTATPTPSNTTDEITWTSSNNAVATVADGVVTPVGLGTTIITATCGEQTATCSVTVDNVLSSYVSVCGYLPQKRSSLGMATTSGKITDTGDTADSYIIAKNQATELYPIESNSDVSTDPYRFVPIIIPAGATKIKVSCTLGNFYTRTLWFDSTKQETTTNIGAWCVQGATSGFDQGSSTAGPVVTTIPTDITGLDSVAVGVATGGSVAKGTKWADYASSITIEFLKE